MRSGLPSKKSSIRSLILSCLFSFIFPVITEGAPAGSSADRLAHFAGVVEDTDKNVKVSENSSEENSSGNSSSDRMSHFAGVVEDTEKNVKVSGNSSSDRLSHFAGVVEDTEKNVKVSGNSSSDRLSHFAGVVEETEKNVKVSGNEASDRLLRFANVAARTYEDNEIIEDKVLVRGKDYGEKELGIFTRFVADNRSIKNEDHSFNTRKTGQKDPAEFVETASSFSEKPVIPFDLNGLINGITSGGRAFFGSGGDEISLGVFTLTAYDACVICCGKTDGITATGTHATQGRTIAVDPNVIPYGSRVRIGEQIYVAEDTGGRIKGNHIDVFLNTHEEARQFGVRKAEVFLLK